MATRPAIYWADRVAIAVLVAMALIAAFTVRDDGLGWDDVIHSQYGALLLKLYDSGFADTTGLSGSTAATALCAILISDVSLSLYNRVKQRRYEYTPFNAFTSGIRQAQHNDMLYYWSLALKQASDELRARLAKGGAKALIFIGVKCEGVIYALVYNLPGRPTFNLLTVPKP